MIQLTSATKYYCGKDVERHLRRWQKAASDKKIYQFQLDLEDPAMYLPEAFDMWREILQRGGLSLTLAGRREVANGTRTDSSP